MSSLDKYFKRCVVLDQMANQIKCSEKLILAVQLPFSARD